MGPEIGWVKFYGTYWNIVDAFTEDAIIHRGAFLQKAGVERGSLAAIGSIPRSEGTVFIAVDDTAALAEGYAGFGKIGNFSLICEIYFRGIGGHLSSGSPGKVCDHSRKFFSGHILFRPKGFVLIAVDYARFRSPIDIRIIPLGGKYIPEAPFESVLVDFALCEHSFRQHCDKFCAGQFVIGLESGRGFTVDNTLVHQIVYAF